MIYFKSKKEDVSISKTKAAQFLEHEKEFRLGALPTEQSHQHTRQLSDWTKDDLPKAITTFLEVDDDLLPMLERVFHSEPYARMVRSFKRTLKRGGRLYFVGCGATGRLSILLEAAWREFCGEQKADGDWSNRIRSVMAGGDYALIRSVEGYEDHTIFGKRQLEEAGLTPNDSVVAITEGGETSFVIGGAWKGVELGCDVFFVFNNPADVLEKTVQRSREVIESNAITKIDLSTGPMGITGSTRLQATTSEFIVLATALEEAIAPEEEEAKIVARSLATCRGIFSGMRSPGGVDAIAALVEQEAAIYQSGGLVTYWIEDFQLDVLTDTTERAPTFSTPPFRKYDDAEAPPSWVFTKHRKFNTNEAWENLLKRSPRGLTWNADTFRELKVSGPLCSKPPKLDCHEILKFRIGNEADPSRHPEAGSLAVDIYVQKNSGDLLAVPCRRPEFGKHLILLIGESEIANRSVSIHLPIALPSSPLKIASHLAVKLYFNAVSSLTMTKLGRVIGNWMAFVECTNKKLIDRSIRLIVSQTGLEYNDACYALFETLEELAHCPPAQRATTSPAMTTVQRILNSRD